MPLSAPLPASPRPTPAAPPPLAATLGRPRPPALTCSSSLTLSMGATAVLEMAAATPPARKSLAKDTAASVMAGAARAGGDAGRRRREAALRGRRNGR